MKIRKATKEDAEKYRASKQGSGRQKGQLRLLIEQMQPGDALDVVIGQDYATVDALRMICNSARHATGLRYSCFRNGSDTTYTVLCLAKTAD